MDAIFQKGQKPIRLVNITAKSLCAISFHKSPVSGTNRLGCKEPKKHNANSQIIAQRMKDEGIKLLYLLNGIFMIKVNLGN